MMMDCAVANADKFLGIFLHVMCFPSFKLDGSEVDSHFWGFVSNFVAVH